MRKHTHSRCTRALMACATELMRKRIPKHYRLLPERIDPERGHLAKILMAVFL